MKSAGSLAGAPTKILLKPKENKGPPRMPTYRPVSEKACFITWLSITRRDRPVKDNVLMAPGPIKACKVSQRPQDDGMVQLRAACKRGKGVNSALGSFRRTMTWSSTSNVSQEQIPPFLSLDCEAAVVSSGCQPAILLIDLENTLN